jgi:hypothetical protein
MAECGRGCVIARPGSGWFLTMPYGGNRSGFSAAHYDRADPRRSAPAEAVKYQILVMFLIAGAQAWEW